MSRLPRVILGKGQTYSGIGDPMNAFLRSQKPIVLNEFQVREGFESGVELDQIMIPPLNTDVRFKMLSVYKGDAVSHTHDNMICEDFACKEKNSRQDTLQYLQQQTIGILPEQIHENFSWAITTEEDTPEDAAKKSIINKVPSQFACGSCWAVCIAGTISDCFVVSGATTWAPQISSTYIMGILPTSIHQRCAGGNPASALEALVNYDLADTSCIDYSWCSGDEQICKSVDSSNHFDANYLSETLNNQIPKNPAGCYYGNIEKWSYNIDSANSFNISETVRIDTYRNTVRAHILDNGPIVGGFVVLQNFFKGQHADPTLNGGVYFDRADYNNYSGGNLSFYDNLTDQASGLHAISIVGYGVAKNIQYDNNKFGDVPYWHCRNSWGNNWGNCGFFKMAMYPFNQVSQFDQLVYTSLGGPVGGVIMVKATKRPKRKIFDQIDQRYFSNINKIRNDSYYRANAEEVMSLNSTPTSVIIQPTERSPSQNQDQYLPIILLISILAILVVKLI
jgi:hypothetical protein